LDSGPQPVIGGDVEYQPASGHGALKRWRVAQIAGDGFHLDAGNAAPGTHQRAHRVASLHEQVRHVPAQKPGRAGDEG